MRVSRTLVIEVSRREVSVGEPITVRVRDKSNRPVEGAAVTVGSKRTRTNARGLCELTIESPGFWKLTARKSPTERVAYRPTARLLRAVPRAPIGRPPPA